MIEEFRRGDKWWKIVLGFGRIQRVRSIYTEHLPERAKRALLANMNADGGTLLKDMPPDEIQRYNETRAMRCSPPSFTPRTTGMGRIRLRKCT